MHIHDPLEYYASSAGMLTSGCGMSACASEECGITYVEEESLHTPSVYVSMDFRVNGAYGLREGLISQ